MVAWYGTIQRRTSSSNSDDQADQRLSDIRFEHDKNIKALKDEFSEVKAIRQSSVRNTNLQSRRHTAGLFRQKRAQRVKLCCSIELVDRLSGCDTFQ